MKASENQMQLCEPHMRQVLQSPKEPTRAMLAVLDDQMGDVRWTQCGDRAHGGGNLPATPAWLWLGWVQP